MKELKHVTVIGLGLLGGSIMLGISRSFSGIKTVGYSHRQKTRQKARRLLRLTKIDDDINLSVRNANLVILATPICTFEEIFESISDSVPKGCIVTDVGSTKVMPHRWAARKLPKGVHYVGSHPVAGSEQRGVEFARDDLFEGADCILTSTKTTNRRALGILRRFWSGIGCSVKLMRPTEHDRIFANVSHLPHMTAAALINASNSKELRFAGKGFIDTSRIASGPSNIWADVLLTNDKNSIKGIDKITGELLKLKKAIKSGDKKRVEQLLAMARRKRTALINQKIEKKEPIW